MASLPGVIKLPALGRPFSLGMLYDCRSEMLIPGITLWDNETLKQGTNIQMKKTADFSIIAEDTIEKKASELDIEAGLKLSFLGGLVEVSGSAKYLDDRKSSSHQSRVTMKYKCTSRYEQLTMAHLGRGKFEYPEVFDQGHATHVVTGILYGAQAFFVFDHYRSDEETNKRTEGELHVLVKALPGIQIDGDGKLDMSEEDEKRANKLQIQFHGDFQPSTNPTTYADAVRLYKDLPQQLGPNQEKASPIMVWLYPLEHLDGRAAKLVREISANLVSRTEQCIERIHALTTRCNDLSSSPACARFPSVRERLSEFHGKVNEYRIVFTKQLTPILPKIRGGGAEESELMQVLFNKEESPFSFHRLDQWLNNCEELIRVMETYITSMKSINFASSPGTLAAAIMSPEIRYCVSFNFQLSTEDPLIVAMHSYFQHLTEASFKHASVSVSNVSLHDQVDESMATNARHFIDFHRVNSAKQTTSFIVAEEKLITDRPGGFIYLYKESKIVDKDFKPPSRPGQPEEELSEHDSLKLKWSAPDTGVNNITHYTVSHKAFGSDSGWTLSKTSAATRMYTIANLKLATAYQVKVTAECDAGSSVDSDISVMTTRPTGPPGKPKVWQASAFMVSLEWTKPLDIAEAVTVQSYDIERTLTQKDDWQHCAITSSADVTNADVPHEVGAEYEYRVIAKCEKATSLPSEASDPVAIQASTGEVPVLKERVRAERSTKIANIQHPSRYQVHLKTVTANEASMVRKKTFGTPQIGVPEKVILIIGATGAGKTTFINGIMNYVLGVEWNDDFRFRLVEEDEGKNNQAKSQTQWITAYTLNHADGFKVPYTLTIIDTPGFGDTTGIEGDKRITEQLRNFFSTTGDEGIDHIDAVGFVTPSSLPRLTPTQRYIFGSILSLFAKDIGGNIFLLVTFADGKKPPVLAGAKEADMPYKKYFKFNNSALFASNKSGDVNSDSGSSSSDEENNQQEGQFDKMFWKMGISSYKKFLQQPNKIKSTSLQLTQNVLDDRYQLELIITGIQKEIESGLNILEKLKKEVAVLNDHKADIERNRSFTYTVDEEKMTKIDIPNGSYTTNCLTCNYTCHFPCQIPNDEDKERCAAMTSGQCKVCPKKCHWRMHHNVPYRFETQIKKVQKTSDDLQDRYEKAEGEKMSAEKKPNPLSTVEYIDILIDSEKGQAKPGWMDRVRHLQIVRQQAETLAKLTQEGYDPFVKYQEIIDESKSTVQPEAGGVMEHFTPELKEGGNYLKRLLDCNNMSPQ